MDRLEVLRSIASKDLITIHEGVILITEYIFDMTGKRIVINGTNLKQDLFEKAVTIASNYYILKPNQS